MTGPHLVDRRNALCLAGCSLPQEFKVLNSLVFCAPIAGVGPTYQCALPWIAGAYPTENSESDFFAVSRFADVRTNNSDSELFADLRHCRA